MLGTSRIWREVAHSEWERGCLNNAKRTDGLRYKLSIVECRALESTARSLTDAATEQARLRGVTREIADFAATQMKGSIDSAAQTSRQLLEDVQASRHEAIAGNAILKSYSEETRKHFAAVIKSLIDDAETRALNLAHGRMDEWSRKPWNTRWPRLKRRWPPPTITSRASSLVPGEG